MVTNLCTLATSDFCVSYRRSFNDLLYPRNQPLPTTTILVSATLRADTPTTKLSAFYHIDECHVLGAEIGIPEDRVANNRLAAPEEGLKAGIVAERV